MKIYIKMKNYQYPPYNTHKETFKGKPQWQRKKTFGFDWENNLPIPVELPEQEWPINYDRNMDLLRCLSAIDESVGRMYWPLWNKWAN